jgi:hypothetical protein
MPDRVAAIRARLADATPGPWERNNQHTTQHGIAGPFGLHATAWGEGDAEFIAHARADVSWLLDEVERLEAERGTWMRMLDCAGLAVAGE